MAHFANVQQLSDYIGYPFENLRYLERALTAPGSVVEDPDGNRDLAHIGDAVIHLAIVSQAIDLKAPRSSSNTAVKIAAARTHRAAVAKHLNIDKLIKCSPRQGDLPPSTNTLSLAVSAIVGAVWHDSGQSIDVAKKIIQHLGIYHVSDQSIPLDVVSHERVSSTSLSPLGSNAKDNSMFMAMELASGITPSMVFDEWIDFDAGESPSYTQDDIRGEAPNAEASSSHDDFERITIVNTSELDSARGSHWTNENLGALNTVVIYSDGTTFEYELPNESSLQVESISDGSSDQRNYRGSYAQASSTSERPDMPDLPTAAKKIRASSGRAVSCRPEVALLAERIKLEKERWQISGRSYPEKYFQSPVARIPNSSRTLELEIFSFAIGSSESIAIFQDIVRASKHWESHNRMTSQRTLKPTERVRLIEQLDDKVVYLGFLRKCHIYQLVADSSRDVLEIHDGFINNTPGTISSAKKTEVGNPRNLEHAQVTRAMMEEYYPGLEIQTQNPDYAKRYRCITDMRRLGQRLTLLVGKFGFGVLALLPLVADASSPEHFLSINNSFILSFTTNEFRQLIIHLEETQGAVLRSFSSAVEDLAIAVFEDSLNKSGKVALELVPRTDITKYPKGSPELLRLISQPGIPEY